MVEGENMSLFAVDGIHLKCLRLILNITYLDQVTNEERLRTTKQK